MDTHKTTGTNSWLGQLVHLVTVLTVIVASAIWLQGSLHSIDKRLTALESHVQDRWSRTDMKLWAQDLQLLNNAIEVPGVQPSVLYQGTDGQ
jgi:hypothetical protein